MSKGTFRVFNKDSLDILKQMVEKGIKVDAIITDPPYASTRLEWDKQVEWTEWFPLMWSVLKENGVLIIFSDYKNAHKLITKDFKYKLYWNKTKGTDVLNANRKPLNAVEEILVFYKKPPVYNPQKTAGEPYELKQGSMGIQYDYKNTKEGIVTKNDGDRLPLTWLTIPNTKNKHHPTEKPLELMEWLIKTYTNENDIVLDIFMGSGTTGVAALANNRKFVGVELSEEYFNIAKGRLEND